MFILIKEIRYHDGQSAGIRIVGYSTNESLLLSKSTEKNAIYEEKMNEFTLYKKRYTEYDVINPPPKISSFQDAYPHMDIPTVVSTYRDAHANWLHKKIRTLGQYEEEPTFDFFSVKKIEEIIQ